MNKLVTQYFMLLFFLSAGTFAALPPLSQQDREFMATDIVSGEVLSVAVKMVGNSEDFADIHYTVNLMVTGVHKGEFTRGEVVRFSFWRAMSRPGGWCGPSGQRYEPEIGMHITAYLTKSRNGTFGLLDPNGYDKIEQACPAAAPACCSTVAR